MSWNYRVMKRMGEKGENEFGIYEVYYDENEKVQGYTSDPITPVRGSVEELLYELNLMMEAFKEEALDYD